MRPDDLLPHLRKFHTTQQGTSPCITDPLDMPFLFELSTMGVLQDLVSWWTWFSQKQFVGVL